MRRNGTVRQIASLASGLALLVFPARSAGEIRHYDLRWTVLVEDVPPGAAHAQVWIAIPQELPEQAVTDLRVETDLPWQIVADATFGNRVVRVAVDDPPAALSIALSASVERRSVDAPRPAILGAEERALYLRPEALVSLSPRIRALSERIGDSPRDRYDYVLASMDYDKTAPGWGRGDSERACDVGKGNCTDFHSLFMSLSRAGNVPAVFEMGYSTVPGGETDRIGGYHCWAWFYDDDVGAWIPVDISEADKNPGKADYFYGHLDADRITFSRGRDVALPGMQGPPLNYLPSGAYAEIDGEPREEGVSRSLTYAVRGGPDD